MVIDLKFSRFESAPWGFRLIGGSDFDIPLTVIKVVEGSLAESAGLRVGDVIVRINDESASWMTHSDAHDVIMRAGNNFFFGVMREGEEHENQFSPEQYIQQESHTPNSFNKSPIPEEEIYQQNETSSIIDVEHQNIDEEIAEIMSETEQEQQNDVGVFPKPGICMSSEVLRTINEEVKFEMGKFREKRELTTFLQKPNRPIPKSKKELEEEHKRIPYVVQIVKQPKPRVAPDRPPSPPPPPVIEPEPLLEPILEEPPKEEVLPPIPNDSEIPDLEQTQNISKIESEQQIHQESKMEVSEQHIEETQTIIEALSTSQIVEVVKKTEEEIALERQLADVQKQLLALSNLPSTIQATLDSVTKQLSELLPAFRLQSPILEDSKKEKDTEVARRDKETMEIMKNCQDEIMKLSESKILEIPYIPPPPTKEEIEYIKREQQQLQLDNELAYKKEKDQKQSVISELEKRQRLLREGTPRKSRLFGPLTPQERPLVLPGGRRWRKPKDAYNDEFIAEVLSSQAELIVGTTLGKTFEKSNIGHDERHYNFIALSEQLNQRVNFLKYQKPEKKIDLQKSEVYKIIHHLDGGPKRGIEVRPPKVIAADDIVSISCK